MKHLKLWLILIIFFHFKLNDATRVCPTFEEYYELFSNNCFESPLFQLNITEILQYFQYNTEEHFVTTEDGYELLLIRAYIGTKPNEKAPIIIGHGIFTNSIIFSYRGNKSLAGALAENNYDVWLMNYRGSKYSRNNINYSSNSRKFWQFNIHNLGVNDLRSVVNYVHRITDKKAIYFGYSLGSAAAFVYTSSFPDEARNKLLGIISSAAVAYINTRSILLQIYLANVQNYHKLIFNQGEVNINPNNILRSICSYFPFQMKFCSRFVGQIVGYDLAQLSPVDGPFAYALIADSASSQIIDHYAQIYSSKKFQQFDYGSVLNAEKYGQLSPPEYNFSRISIPVHIFVGENDWLGTIQDATQIYNQLQDNIQNGFDVIKFPKWNHLDFFNAADIVKLFLEPVLKVAGTMKN